MLDYYFWGAYKIQSLFPHLGRMEAREDVLGFMAFGISTFFSPLLLAIFKNDNGVNSSIVIGFVIIFISSWYLLSYYYEPQKIKTILKEYEKKSSLVKASSVIYALLLDVLVVCFYICEWISSISHFLEVHFNL